MYAYPIHSSEARSDHSAQPAAICASRYVLKVGGGSPITVRGGTFVNHRPGVDQDPGTIRVAEGYKTISEVREDGNTYYTVVPEE